MCLLAICVSTDWAVFPSARALKIVNIHPSLDLSLTVLPAHQLHLVVAEHHLPEGGAQVCVLFLGNVYHVVNATSLNLHLPVHPV